MDLFADLWLGMSVALTPANLLFLMIGAMVGMIVGIIPGFGPSAGIAILMPLTFGMDPIGAVVMLAAIYYAAMYGGTITSILLNTPGESATVASTFDGYPLAQQGRAGPALVMQAVASFVGGTVGVILITLLAPLFSQLARDFIPVAIGLFGLGELFYAFYQGRHASGSGGIVQYQRERRFWPEIQDWIETRVTLVRASLLGFAIGVIPGAGATIASLMSYSIEKSASKQPERFGKGAMAGLVGPETANNAASAGAMVPLLTLGIPGSASTAVLLAAFLLCGLRPGPLLMSQNPEFAWGLIASMYLGNVALLLLNIFAIPLFVLMLRVPYRILAPAVIVLCTIGTYSVNGSIVETWIMLIAGIAGFFMKLFGFSPAAVVLALVLGPLAEEALRQTLTISRGSFAIFVERPMSVWIVAITLAILLAAPVLRRLQPKAA